MAILNAMPAEYANTVDRLIDSGEDDDDLTVARVRSSLLMKENQLAEGVPPQLETKALLAVADAHGDRSKRESEFTGRCYICRKKGHMARVCKRKRVEYEHSDTEDEAEYEDQWARYTRPKHNTGGRPWGRPIPRGPSGRPHQPKLHAVREELEEGPNLGQSQQEGGIYLTFEQLQRLMHKGPGPSPHVGYVGKPSTSSGDPTPRVFGF
jgi:hypothetical protein